MAILSELNLYPIKSCAGIALREATLTRHGLHSGGVGDREWMLVDAGGVGLTQRECPRMALIVPRIEAAALLLSAPGLAELSLPLAQPQPQPPSTGDGAALTVRLWDEQLAAQDCGDAAAAWVTAATGTACRLVRFPPAAQRLASARWTGGIAAPTLFSDGYPVLVAGSASLDDINTRLQQAGRARIPMNRFRPNVVLADIAAFEEDYCESYRFGATVLKAVKPCPRCPMPSVDQATGIVGPDPLELMRDRAKPEVDGAICFGMNAIVAAGGNELLVLGQEVEVTLAF
jgi:uncharacterized protein YcbX